MLWWLVDNATVVYLVLGLAALVLAAIFWSNRRVKFLGAAVVLLGLIALFFLVTRLVVTDRKQLYLNVQAMARGVEEADPEKVFRHFSREFRQGGIDFATSRERLAGLIRARRVSDISVTNFDYEKLSRADRQAQISFFVTFTPDREGRARLRCRLQFALEGDDWRLTGIELFMVGSGQPVAIPI